MREARDRDTVYVTEISPEGVRSVWDLVEIRLKWRAFDEIRGTPEFVCLYEGGTPFIIPRRSFLTAEWAEAFLQQAIAWHAAAVSQTPSRIKEHLRDEA